MVVNSLGSGRFFLQAQENLTAPHELLRNYGGDYTDTDGDGMTDVFNPYGTTGSIPKVSPSTITELRRKSIPDSGFNDAVLQDPNRHPVEVGQQTAPSVIPGSL